MASLVARILGVSCLLGALALPPAAGAAEDESKSNDPAQKMNEAAERMVITAYLFEPAEWKRPSDVMASLRKHGYTKIDDFDIEHGAYEVEATTPDGNEVELEIDPVTGAIRKIEENFF